MKYELFFFKENTRTYDAESLISYVLEDEHMKMVDTGDKVSLMYKNPLIDLSFSLNFTKASRVPDLTRIEAKYLDLDFFVEIDILLPMVKLNLMIDYVEKICSQFNFLIYNVLFEGVTRFNRDIIAKTYDIVRRSYAEKYQQEYNALNYLNKSAMDGYYKYIIDAKSTNEYYDNKYLFLNAHFRKDFSANKVYIVCDLLLDSAVILPPYVDFLAIDRNGVKTLYNTSEVYNVLFKYIKDFPGFVKGTKMIEAKKIKKIKKIVSKMKIKPINEQLEVVKEESLIDF